MSALLATALAAAGYLLGAVPFGLLVGRRLAGLDVRAVGSGNIGATNVARAAGWRIGALVLILDALKGFLPALAARLLPLPDWAPVAAGAAAILGHVFPIYLRFKGGKGVATALGVFLVLAPVPTLAGALAFAGTYALSRVVSAGSLAGVLTASLAAFSLEGPTPVSWLLAATAALVLARHRGNIVRLLGRNERKL